MFDLLKRFLVASLLAIFLSSAPLAVLTLPGCSSISSIFQSDPTGATLLSLKDAYEASVKTAGRLYLNKQITEVQLRNFRDKANSFYAMYTSVVSAHAANKLTEEDPQVKNLKLAMAGLEALVSSFVN